MDPSLVSTSKFLSLVLRHQPEAIGIALDDAGWVNIEQLLNAARTHGRELDLDLLLRVVHENDKQRFAISPDGFSIRASQGHSFEIDLGLEPVPPPDTLYHGTVARFLESIRQQGLVAGNRQFVHLSSDRRTAEIVGRRRGRPVILTVAAANMHRAGHSFFLSANGVWLTEYVLPRFIIDVDKRVDA